MTELFSGALVTATVTPPAPDLNDTIMVGLAREMAWNIRPPEEIFKTYQLTEEQFNHFVLPNAFYKRAFQTLLLEWESAKSTNQRLAIKSAAALEDKLPDIAARMGDKREALTGVVETAKLLAKIAGAGEQKVEAAIGEKFTIQINLGGDRQTFQETISATPVRTEPEGDRAATTFQIVTEGPGSSPPVQQITQGTGEDEALFQVPAGD